MASKHDRGILPNDDQYIVCGSNFLLLMTSLLFHDVSLRYVFYSSMESLGPHAHTPETTWFLSFIQLRKMAVKYGHFTTGYTQNTEKL